MTRRIAVVVGLLVGMLGAWLQPAGAAPGFTTLDPGKPAKLTETVPLQVVMLGYNQDDVPSDWFGEYMTNEARPIDRTRTWRNINKATGTDDWYWNNPLVEPNLAPMGLQYSFDHHLVYTDSAYEDQFFSYLLSIGVDERALTGNDVSLFEYLYNLQATRKLDITNNLVIDPTKVEAWLLDHPAPGIDSSKNTVVFVNWWGRPDFRFHDYEVPGDPQSETGVNFAKTYWSSRMTAWGGTSAANPETGHGRPSRTWFHDLSAGPDWRTGGWVLDNNLGGYGPDPSWQNIFPPVWEYALGGAQDRWALPDALGVITRFVAVDFFFAASPLYGNDTDANVSDDIELDITKYGNVATTPALLQQKLGDLLGRPPKIDIDQRPYAGTGRACNEAFVAEKRCRPETDPAVYPVDADYFTGAERERSKWQDGSAGYEAPSFLYNTAENRKWIAFADDNWTDGNRSAVHSFLDHSSFDIGQGTTSTLIHEYGHHFGLSHPHDGYETEWGPNGYAANSTDNGIFFFTWIGDEVSSVMSYQFVENDFSQFDLDNYQRWQAARYLRGANMIAAQVLASPRASAGASRLTQADAAFNAAQRALTAHDYPTAAAKADDGYQLVRAAASAAKVTVPTVDRWAMTPPGSWHGHATHEAFAPTTEPVGAMAGPSNVPAAVLTGFGSTTRR